LAKPTWNQDGNSKGLSIGSTARRKPASSSRNVGASGPQSFRRIPK
jgi:hypothetical protein